MSHNASDTSTTGYDSLRLAETVNDNTDAEARCKAGSDVAVSSDNRERDEHTMEERNLNVVCLDENMAGGRMKTGGLMNAIYYEKPREFEVRSIPIPDISDSEVLFKVICCGICGSDKHLHEGGFLAKFPLTPGHEVVGTIVKLGKNVTGFSIGDRCVADPTTYCNMCFQCRRGKTHLCKKRACRGLTFPGGCAEYVSFPATHVYKIDTLTDQQACLVEPMSCVVHAMDMLRHPAGADVLVLGAGPSGLLFSQLLKLNGAIKVVLASNKGRKLEIARHIQAADEFVEIEREQEKGEGSDSQLSKLLKEKYPLGFDVVIEATGSEEVLNAAIYHVRRGGTLLMYGLYPTGCTVRWPAVYIFFEEIQIVTSIGQCGSFARAIAYLESGKIRTEGIVTDVFTIYEYERVLDKVKSRDACKVIVKPF